MPPKKGRSYSAEELQRRKLKQREYRARKVVEDPEWRAKEASRTSVSEAIINVK